jgi:hypothetical protein
MIVKRWSQLALVLLVLAVPIARAEDPKPAPAAPPMQGHMQGMQRSMDQLQKTTDPAKRRELMRDHMAQMQAAMKDMHGMMDCRGADDCGGSMHGGMMNHAKPEPMEKQLDAMRHRQNAMQSMMEQMLQHQEQMMKE